jgi:DNA-directed RNA polymerase specialized sigma24 family protein
MTAPLPSRSVLDRLNRAHIDAYRAIDARPEPRSREAMPIRALRGVRTFQEVADIVGMSEPGVKLIVYRVLKKLRPIYKEMLNEGRV